jgi:hypothetical protein
VGGGEGGTVRSGKSRTARNKWYPSVAAFILYIIMLHELHLTSLKRSYWLLSYSRLSSPAMEIKSLIIPYSKSCPLHLKPRQFGQYGNVTTFLKIRLILSFCLCPGLPSGPFLSGMCAFYIAILIIFRDNCNEIFRSDRIKLRHDNLRGNHVRCYVRS